MIEIAAHFWTTSGMLRLMVVCFWINMLPWAQASDPRVASDEKATLLLVVGAPGEPEYAQQFQDWAQLWLKNCQTAGAHQITVGLEDAGPTNDLDRLKGLFEREPKETTRELWIVLIGHGTFDGKQAKFNLRGPDLSAEQLAGWLQPFQRPLAIINTASSSGPFLNKLSAQSRVVITATRSGYEQNYARFGRYFSEAIADAGADLDKDGQTSLLEAFLMASRRIAEFYKTEGRLVTEHALLDDNGDGLGTPPDWFRGIRVVKKAPAGTLPDGLRAHQLHLIRSEFEQKLSPALRARRNELELAVNQLRESKEQFETDEYYARLEKLLVELAELYETSEQPEAEPSRP